MQIPLLQIVLLASPFLLVKDGAAYQVENNPFRRAETLDPEEKYLLEWEVNWTNKRVTFNVTVQTKSWIGFGLSNDGLIGSGADMVIGGVGPKGQGYFSDRHMDKGSDVARLDRQQDYTLHSAREGRTHTTLTFSRAFDTCDDEDYAITLNKVTLIWAYGQYDSEEGLHPQNRGIYHTHLLDPDYAPKIERPSPSGEPRLVTRATNEAVPENTKTWTINRSLVLPTNETSYICSMHKAPRVRRKQHWIGFEITFPNEESRLHSHHMVIYRCNPPPGFTAREFFEPHLSNPGEACYIFRAPSTDLRFPIQFCSTIYVEWAIGARAFFMPNHVGFPLGESPDEYYMIQMHYDNRNQEAGLQVDLRLDNFYTDQLRPNDGGMMVINHDIPALPESIMIPPNSLDHRLYSQCSPECTRKMLPPGGITVSAVTLHEHNAGTGVRLRHFRGGRELPWILFDDNYDNWVQPFRHLRNEVKVMPGDQLVADCHYTTNDTSAVGGFSTQQEMCSVIIIYHQRIQEYSFCTSGIISSGARERLFGIRNVTWIQDELEWVVRTPRRLAGLKLSEVSDNFIDWSPERRAELQRHHETHPHTGHCHQETYTRSLAEIARAPRNPLGVPSAGPVNTEKDYVGPVSYPFGATPYSPPGSQCRERVLGVG